MAGKILARSRPESLRVMRKYSMWLTVCLAVAVSACREATLPDPSPGLERALTSTPTLPSPSMPTITPRPAPSATATGTPPTPVYLGISQLWRYPTLETVWSVSAHDLEGNADREVLAASYDKGIYALTGDGRLIWRYQAGGPVYCLDTGDLDGDGRAEVVAGGDDNTVHVLGAGGERLWQQHVGSRVVAVDVAEAEGESQGEVLAGCQDGRVLALGADGAIRWQLPSDSGVSTVEWVDLGGEGGREGLAGRQDGTVSLISPRGDVEWTYHASGHVRELRVYDLDGDGQKEIIVGSADGWLHVVNAVGVVAWKHHLHAPVMTVDAGDMDGDGRGEVAVGTGGPGSKLCLLSHDGGQRWSYDVPGAVWAVRVVDLDRKGGLEVLAGGDDGNVRILDSYGRLLAGYHTGRRVHGLATTEANEDGLVDIVVRSGNDVCLLTPSVSESEVGQLQTITAPATSPHWQGPIPGLAEGDEELIELVAVGDVMLSRTVEERMEIYGSQYPFEAVGDLLRSADFAIGGLEAPFSLQGEPLGKRFVFREHPRHAAGLAWAGFDLLSLATNHQLDFGEEAFTDTLEVLEEGGLAYVGAGRSYQEAHRPLLWEAKGRRVAFLAYAATRWKGSPEVPTSELVSFAELATVRDEVQRARQSAELVVVILHLGTEYQVAPDQEQLAVSRSAIDAGACLVIGHHSHVVQGTEVYRNGLIVYGLGNFVFDIDVVEGARQGAVLRVLLGERGVEAADLLPVRIVDDLQPQLMVGEDGLPIVRQVYRVS